MEVKMNNMAFIFHFEGLSALRAAEAGQEKGKRDY